MSSTFRCHACHDSRNYNIMNTYILQELNETKAARIDELLHMLSPDAPALGPARLSELLADDSFQLFVTEDTDGKLAGMLTLTRCHTLSRSKFWIEDVIVDPAYRGQGVGRALVHAAVEHVKTYGQPLNQNDEGVTTQDIKPEMTEEYPSIYLTSNPSRTAARALYRSEGFEEYETGVFRIV